MIRGNNEKGGRKKIKKMKSSCIGPRNASPVKIAYYIQRMIEKNIGTKEIIYIMSSQFGNDDIVEFAKTYRCCVYIDDIRRIANLIYNIPERDIKKTMDTVLHDILIKREILPSEYIREHSHSLEQKREVYGQQRRKYSW